MLKKLSLQSKFVIMILFTIVALVVVSLGSFILIRDLFNSTVNVLEKKGFNNISLVLNADRDIYQALVAYESLINTNPDKKTKEELVSTFKENADQVTQRMGEAKKLFKSGDANWLEAANKNNVKIQTSFNDFENNFSNWRKKVEGIIIGKTLLNEKERKQVNTEFENVRTYIDTIGQDLEYLTAKEVDNANDILTKIKYMIVVIDIVAIIVCLILLMYNLLFIQRNINRISHLAENVASGNKNIDLNEDYKHEFGQINMSIKKIVDRLYWFEQMMDAIKMPISVIDTKQKWTFINKSAEVLIGEKRDSVIGKSCSEWGMPHCNKSSCSLTCMENRTDIPHLEYNGKTYDIEFNVLNNFDGNKIGYIELFKDITSIERSVSYQKSEVKKLGVCLKKLAEGDCDFTNVLSEPDEYTKNEYSNFTEINESLEIARNTIKKLITEFVSTLEHISNSNLDIKIQTDYKGSFNEIKNGLNKIIEHFNGILHEINISVDLVSGGIHQVSDANQHLSQGATQQASAIEELTATIYSINDQIKQNSQNASESSKLANTAKENAVTGNHRMKDMLDAMENINKSSTNISKIIKVIDEIAFQTNILSLNAAVEAARAGQHGKGFAVVAEEVRNLASRSAGAARETTELIENSIKKVELGSKIANETANELNVIVDSIEKAAFLSNEIATASVEQANSIDQINLSINQISSVTENNSALAEENAASSEELSSQAGLLKDNIKTFKLKKQVKF